MTLPESIDHEASLLAAIRSNADLVIDTSSMDVHTLRDLIRERVAQRREKLSLMFESFGYKRGIPSDADLVFDVRVLPNPFWRDDLREYNGLDQPVIEFLEQQAATDAMFADISGFLEDWLPFYESNDRTYMTVAIGCTGGKHRSVYMASRLANHFRSNGMDVQTRHRDLNLSH